MSPREWLDAAELGPARMMICESTPSSRTVRRFPNPPNRAAERHEASMQLRGYRPSFEIRATLPAPELEPVRFGWPDPVLGAAVGEWIRQAMPATPWSPEPPPPRIARACGWCLGIGIALLIVATALAGHHG